MGARAGLDRTQVIEAAAVIADEAGADNLTLAALAGPVGDQVAGEGPIDLVFIPECWNETESMWDQP